MKVTKAFLKWAGGKSQSIFPFLDDEIYADVPMYKERNIKRFIEPFVGSGVVFMNMEADEYIISDVNKDLTNIYNLLKRDGELFIDACKKLFLDSNNTEEVYYRIRKEFNDTNINDEEDKIKRAAFFIYLNRHGFNGLCRYNKSGKFNVPFGKYDRVNFPKEALKTTTRKLERVSIYNQSFEKTIALVEPDDVVYCVPEDTLVYQDGDYLPIKDVVVYETNLGNNNRCVKKHIRSTIEEEIIKLNIMGISRHYDLKLSKNHTVFTYEKDTDSIIEKKAEDLTTKDLLLIDYDKKINNFIPVYKKYNERNKKELSVDYTKHNELAEFLGLYMAEGHVQNGIILSFNFNESHLHLLTKKLMQECFGLEASIHPKSPHESVTQVRCCSKELEKYILNFYNGQNATNKKMKSFVMFWDKNIQINILRGWLKGDGGIEETTDLSSKRKFIRTGKRNKFKYTGTSSSFELATQMYNIALRCGLHPCFKKRVSKYKIPLVDGRTESICYDVYFTMKKDIEKLLNKHIPGRDCGRRFHSNNYLVTRINKIKKVLYTGNMYDLTTSAGNFWCMGNIKIHNCDPPYVPLSDTASFTDYSTDGFNIDQQRHLAKLAEESECRFLISNHDTEVSRELYKNADSIKTIEVSRFISADAGSRKPVYELLAIYNKRN